MFEMVEKPGCRSRTLNQNARAFQQVLQEVFGVSFALFDAATGDKVAGTGSVHGRMHCCDLDVPSVFQLAAAGQALVVPWEGNAFRVSLVLHNGGTPILVAAGVVPAIAESAHARTVEQTRLQAWARDFSERLRLRDQLSVQTRADSEVREQLSSAWKVNLLLGECMQRLRFNRHELRDRQRILQAALQLLQAQALIWAPCQVNQPAMIAGEPPLTAEEAASLARQLSGNPEAEGTGPYLCNDPRNTPWGASFRTIGNLLAFRVIGQGFAAWLIAVNKYGKASARSAEAATVRADFRKSDAALLSPFADMLEMHARGASKFDELRSLFVGLARSLTAAIDAKDAHTAGHSERVARMAVEIGRELQIPADQQSDAHLAGLLHDIGKIGIREAVLCKATPLNPDEIEHLKQHVTIGYRILEDLHPIRHLLPGVLYHHERFDGTGYPEGLAGEKIPFLARLLAVADSIDSMKSERPYRAALPDQQVCEEMHKGAGTSWDPQIVAAALRCKHRLLAIGQRGSGDSRHEGAVMVLQKTDSSLLGPLWAAGTYDNTPAG